MGTMRLRHGSMVSCLAFSPDGKGLASASYDRTVRVWDVATGQERRHFLGHETGVSEVAFAPDGRSLVSMAADRTIRVWEVASGQQRLQVPQGRRGGHSACSADGKTLAWAAAGTDS